MSRLILTFLAVLSRSNYSLGTKLMTNSIKARPQTVAFFLLSGAGLISLFICPFFGGINFASIFHNWELSLIIALALVIGNVLYFKAQVSLDAGTTQIAFSSILIFGTVFSIIFLDSNFSIQQLIGIFILLIALLIVQNIKNVASLKHKSMGAIFTIILSAVFMAIFQVSSAELAKKIDTGTYLFVAYLGCAIILYLLYFKSISKDIIEIKKSYKAFALPTLFACSTSLLYYVFSYFAYRHAPDRGVVVVLLTTQVVFTVILATLFLNERENIKRKSIGAVLALIAGILIKS